MPSPFPGMDPFIEGESWQDFHTDLLTSLRAALVPLIRPRYQALVEEYVYLEWTPESRARRYRPDVSVLARPEPAPARGGVAVAATSAPATVALPIPERQQHRFLEVRREGQLVTAIEILSPENKARGSSGRARYLDKREEWLLGPAHLVEIDLLRGGERLPTEDPLPPAEYYVLAARKERRPVAEVWPVGLRARLPAIPIPLLPEDGEVVLDLQVVFDTVYDRAGYDYALDYTREVEPPLAEADRAWVAEVLAGAASTSD